MIENNYYSAYKQYIREEKEKSEKTGEKKTLYEKLFQNLTDRNGKKFTVLFIVNLIVFIIFLIISLQMIWNPESFLHIWFAIIIVMSIIFIILAIIDCKRRKTSFHKDYTAAWQRALILEKALYEKFQFSSADHYNMVFEDAKKQNQEMLEQIKERRRKAEQILFGGILVTLLAFVSAIVTGLMDNACNTSTDNVTVISDLVKVLAGENNLFSTVIGAMIIFLIIIIPLLFIYIFQLINIHSMEKEQWDFSGFLADIKMLTEIKAGLHPLAGKKQETE